MSVTTLCHLPILSVVVVLLHREHSSGLKESRSTCLGYHSASHNSFSHDVLLLECLDFYEYVKVLQTFWRLESCAITSPQWPVPGHTFGFLTVSS